MRGAVRAANEIDVVDDAVDDVGFVDGEALLFEEVAVDNALAHRFLHDRGGVEAVRGEGDIAAALVEEAPLVGAVGAFTHCIEEEGRATCAAFGQWWDQAGSLSSVEPNAVSVPPTEPLSVDKAASRTKLEIRTDSI